eukprot:gene2576-5493_t
MSKANYFSEQKPPPYYAWDSSESQKNINASSAAQYGPNRTVSYVNSMQATAPPPLPRVLPHSSNGFTPSHQPHHHQQALAHLEVHQSPTSGYPVAQPYPTHTATYNPQSGFEPNTPYNVYASQPLVSQDQPTVQPKLPQMYNEPGGNQPSAQEQREREQRSAICAFCTGVIPNH